MFNDNRENGGQESSSSSGSIEEDDKDNKPKDIAQDVIVEDDEYDGIHYLPTPQFINDRFLLGVGNTKRGEGFER